LRKMSPVNPSMIHTELNRRWIPDPSQVPTTLGGLSCHLHSCAFAAVREHVHFCSNDLTQSPKVNQITNKASILFDHNIVVWLVISMHYSSFSQLQSDGECFFQKVASKPPQKLFGISIRIFVMHLVT